MATSRLANILQQEYKTKGLIGGAASSLGKRSLEKLDIRNALFSGGGIGSIIGTKIFGKGYSATRGSGTGKTTSPNVLTSDSSSILQDININSKITAKNSMALPAMAKQMNIMQKNIAKLVTVSGGTPTKKADSFFSSSKFRENQYEAQFNKGTKPTKVEEKEKSSGGFLGMISSLASGIMSVISSAVSAVGNSIGSLSGLFTGLGIAVAGIGVAFSRVLGFLAKSPVGRLLGLVGLSVAASKAMAGTTKTPGEAGNPTTESSASGLNQSVIDTAAGVGGAIAATGIIGGASKLLTAGSQTKTSILDAKTTPSNISYKDKTPTTKWGKFLAFVERKSPTLFAKFGARLAAAGALATIPVVGWITALIQFGFSIYTAYEIYQLWKEYSNQDADSTSPVSVSNSGDSGSIDYSAAADAMSGSTTSAPIMSPSSPSTTPSSTTPSNKSNPAQTDGLALLNNIMDREGITDKSIRDRIISLAQIESSMNPNAKGPVLQSGMHKGDQARGLLQIMPKTAPEVGFSAEDIEDPTKAATAGVKYFMKNLNKFKGNLDAATVAHHSGPAGAEKFLKTGSSGTVDLATGLSTDNYLAKVQGQTSTASMVPPSASSSGSVLASASAARETASMSKSAFSSADMADILAVLNSGKTASAGQSQMNQVVSTSKSTPYHSDFYSNLVRTQAL